MEKNRLIKIIVPLFLLLIIIGVFVFQANRIENVQAGTEHDISGLAWSENIGWISFNCTNCEGNPDCDRANFCNGTHKDFGVDIDISGILSGYAWSENIGWISFNEADLVGCPSGTCRAFINLSNGEVSGWAKVLSFDGWIHLRDADYGVYLDIVTREFKGFAWSDNIIGWISFNHLNCDSDNNGISDVGNYTCPLGEIVSDYKVLTSFSFPPEAVDLQVTEMGYCDIPQEYFTWTFQDIDPADTQSAYQLQVDREGTFLSLAAGEVDTDKVNSSSEQKSVLVQRLPSLDTLTYNQIYYWRVKVWDNHDTESAWSSGASFQTPLHVSPTIRFEWIPSRAPEGEVVQFCSIIDTGACVLFSEDDMSICYSIANNQIVCDAASFNWTFPDGTEHATSSSDSIANPAVRFNSSGSLPVTLEITDNGGTCGLTQNISISLPFPQWKETEPD